jgi:hypothetical protein
MLRIDTLFARLAVLLGAAAAVHGADGEWPQWRGPNRDGLSTESGLLKKWPAKGPPLAWKTTGIGGGYSSVSVAQGRIFTMGEDPASSHVRSLKSADGALLWAARVGKPGGGDGYPGPRATPTVDGDLALKKPVVYQEIDGLRQYADSRYVIREGNLVGHVTLGVLMIEEACRTLKRNREQHLAGRTTEGLVRLLGGVAFGKSDSGSTSFAMKRILVPCAIMFITIRSSMAM